MHQRLLQMEVGHLVPFLALLGFTVLGLNFHSKKYEKVKGNIIFECKVSSNISLSIPGLEALYSLSAVSLFDVSLTPLRASSSRCF